MNKIILILLISSLFLCFQKNHEDISIVHLSYNVLNRKFEKRKYINSQNSTNFYIGKEHFITKGFPITLNEEMINELELIDINEFVEISMKKREDLIEAGERIGTIKLLTNSEIFKVINLYEKKGSKYLKYRVEWIEEITN